MSEMSDKIKNIRQQTGLSQAKFAETFRISRRTFENWESEKRVPPSYIPDLLQAAVNDYLNPSGDHRWQ